MNEVQDVGAIGVILGWVQVIRGVVPDSWRRALPLFALALGLIYSLVFRTGATLGQRLAAGITLGFAAAGTFSGAKKLMERKGAP
jgi:hypothetical protein